MLRVIVLSGGLDSAVLLADVVAEFGAENVVVVNVEYGSKHNTIERGCASQLALYYKVRHVNLDMTTLFESFESSLLASSPEAIPEGHYAAENMASTVVPMRNLIFATAVAGLAQSLAGSDTATVYLGTHSGDHPIYPDCRPDTLSALAQAILAGSDRRVLLAAPFMRESKIGIVARGLQLCVPFEMTRTCYTSVLPACGKCGSCVERLEAFEENQASDPIEYIVK